MRKLSLKVEELGVETFETQKGGKAERGTVLGHAPTKGMGSDCESIAYPCVTGICDPTYDCTAFECP